MSIEESGTFEDEIYEVTLIDKAVGGRGGIANRQAQQLANRTRWLKEQLETLQGQQIVSLAIDLSGHLIVVLGDETEVNLGSVIGPTGVGMPEGGLVGQMPVKQSLDDYDFIWVDQPENGAPSVSIFGATINGSGELEITLSDGSTINAGSAVVGGGSDWKGDWEPTSSATPFSFTGAFVNGVGATTSGHTVELTKSGVHDSQVAYFSDQVLESGNKVWLAALPDTTAVGTGTGTAAILISPDLEGILLGGEGYIVQGSGGAGLVCVSLPANSSSTIDGDYADADPFFIELDEANGLAYAVTDNGRFSLPFSPVAGFKCAPGLKLAGVDGSSATLSVNWSTDIADLSGFANQPEAGYVPWDATAIAAPVGAVEGSTYRVVTNGGTIGDVSFEVDDVVQFVNGTADISVLPHNPARVPSTPPAVSVKTIVGSGGSTVDDSDPENLVIHTPLIESAFNDPFSGERYLIAPRQFGNSDTDYAFSAAPTFCTDIGALTNAPAGCVGAERIVGFGSIAPLPDLSVWGGVMIAVKGKVGDTEAQTLSYKCAMQNSGGEGRWIQVITREKLAAPYGPSRSGGELRIDVGLAEEYQRYTLDGNVTSWDFAGLPVVGFIEVELEITQDASTPRTCVSPATAGANTAGGAWTVSSTLGSVEVLRIRLWADGTRQLFPQGVMG